MPLQRWFGKNLVYGLMAMIVAVGSPLLLQWLSQKNAAYPLSLLVIVSVLIGFSLACCIYDPLIIFLCASVIFMMIGTKVMLNPVVDYIGGVGAGKFYYGTPDFVLLLGLIAFFIGKLRDPDRMGFRFGKPEFYLLIFTSLTVAAALIAPYKEASYPQMNLYLVMFALFLLWSNTMRRLSRDRLLKVAMRSLAVVLLIQVVICILQLSTGERLGLGFLGEGQVDLRAGVEFSSVTGTFGHPGPLSLFFLICVSIYFPFVLQKRNLFTILYFAAAVVGLVFTFSRTSLSIAAAVLLLEWIFLTTTSVKLSKTRILMVMITIALVLYNFGGSILDRFLNLGNSRDDQITHRLDHYEMAWAYIQKKPLFGYGLNNWSYVTHHMQLLTSVGGDSFFYDNPVHNIYLYLWFEGGLLLLAAFTLIVGFSIVTLFRKMKSGKDFEIGLLACFFCVMVYGVTGWGLFNGSQMIYILYILFSFSMTVSIDGSIQKTYGVNNGDEIRHFRGFRIQEQRR